MYVSTRTIDKSSNSITTLTVHWFVFYKTLDMSDLYSFLVTQTCATYHYPVRSTGTVSTYSSETLHNRTENYKTCFPLFPVMHSVVTNFGIRSR